MNEVYLDIETQDLCEPCIYEIAMSEDTWEIEMKRELDNLRKKATVSS